MTIAETPLLDFSSWSFLTAPLDELLDRLDAHVSEVPIEDERFLGGIVRRDWGLRVFVRAAANPIEKDLVARGVLAHWFGIDTEDWPMGMQFTELTRDETA